MDKKEKDEFIEEIVQEIPKIKKDPKKFISKIILGKKTILKKKKLPPPPPIDPPKIEIKSNADILVESIVKTYWISKWKEQLQIMKYSKQGFNKKRGNFRSFCMKMNNAMKYHQYIYLAKLFDKMEKMPKKENVEHDKFFGKLMIVKNENTNINIKDVNDIIIKSEEKIENKINNKVNNDGDINDKVEIKINLPEIKEVEYKPENEDKKMIEVDKKDCMDIEKNYIDDKNKENNKNEEKKIK